MNPVSRILFISHSASLTGAPMLLLDIAASLDPSQYECSFLLAEEGPLAPRFRALGKTIIDPIYPDGAKYWREAGRFAHRMGLLKSLNPSLLYCNTIHSAKWLFYARLRGIPAITHVHELASGFHELGPLELFLLRRFSTRCVAVSDSVKAFLVGSCGFKPERVDVVRTGIHVGRFGSPRGTDRLRQSLELENAFVIGTVGRIALVKGSDLFLELARAVRDQASVPVKFLVVGTTADKAFLAEWKHRIAGMNLTRDIVFLEDVADVAGAYGVMDLFVSTAREDPFPLVVMEAMASRLPVVAFGTGGIPEAVDAGCGVLVDDLNVGRMAEEILALMRDSRRMADLGERGRAKAGREFDLTKNVVRIHRLIDSLGGRR